MDNDDLRALREMALVDRALTRRSNLARNGASTSAFDEELDKAQRAVLPRHDFVSLEAVERMTLFVRGLFQDHPDLPWIGDDQGFSHRDSAICIENQLSDAPRPGHQAKPGIDIRPGPKSSVEMHVSDLKHVDFATGARTFTTLEPGTLQIVFTADKPGTVQWLANFVDKSLLVLKSHLQFRGFHDVKNTTVSGYDAANVAYNRGLGTQSANAQGFITLTYYWQSTVRVSFREGWWDRLRTLQAEFRLGPSSVVPGQDERVDGLVHQPSEKYFVVPIDPDEDVGSG